MDGRRFSTRISIEFADVPCAEVEGKEDWSPQSLSLDCNLLELLLELLEVCSFKYCPTCPGENNKSFKLRSMRIPIVCCIKDRVRGKIVNNVKITEDKIKLLV